MQQMNLARAADLTQVSDRLPMPLYHQIYLVLREKILDGRYAPDQLVPGEQELARQYSVSRITARRALGELAAEGLVVRERGRGTRVVQRATPPPIRSSVERLQEHLIAMGRNTKARLLEFDYRPAPAEAARALGLPQGAEVQRAERVRLLDGKPFSHLTTFVPADIGRRFQRRDLESKPLLALLARAGVSIGSAEQTITASLADARIGTLLETAVGAPLLRILRTVYDASGRPVEFIVGLYRPDRFQVHMMLERERRTDRDVWSPAARPAGRPKAK